MFRFTLLVPSHGIWAVWEWPHVGTIPRAGTRPTKANHKSSATLGTEDEARIRRMLIRMSTTGDPRFVDDFCGDEEYMLEHSVPSIANIQG